MQPTNSCQPKDVNFLTMAGMAKRCVFWSISNLLVLALIETYGFSNSLATHFYGLFTGGAYILPLIGGFIADRWNYHYPLIVAFIIGAIGCFLISFGYLATLYVGLFLLAFSFGLYQPASLALLGYVYRHYPSIRERGFTTYYGMLYLATFFGMLIIGYWGHTYGWTKPFIFAGIAQLLGLIPMSIFLQNHHLTSFTLHPKQEPKKREWEFDKNRSTVIFILILFSLFFWISYAQCRSSFAVFFKFYVDRTVHSYSLPGEWFLSLQDLFAGIFALVLSKFYSTLPPKKRDFISPKKTALGLFSVSMAFLILTVASLVKERMDLSEKFSPWIVITAQLFMAFGDLLIVPIGLALLTGISPGKYTGLLVGVWSISMGAGYYFGGYLAGLMDVTLSIPTFFALFVVMTLLPALVLYCFSGKLNRLKESI